MAKNQAMTVFVCKWFKAKSKHRFVIHKLKKQINAQLANMLENTQSTLI